MKQNKRFILLTIFTFALVGLLLFSYQLPASEVKEQTDHPVQSVEKSVIMKVNSIQLDEVIEQPPLTEAIIFEKTEQFISILLQDIDENYKVTGLLTKRELIDRYQELITEEAVQPYVDFYFQEREGGLYLVPTELPPWFIPGEPYETRQLDNGNIVIEQENELRIYGTYRIIIEFSYQKDWQIVRIEHPPVNGERSDII